RDDVSADDDETHLHRERDQTPEAVAERRGGRDRRGAECERRGGHADDRERCKHERIWNPALRPRAAAQRGALRPARVGGAHAGRGWLSGSNAFTPGASATARCARSPGTPSSLVSRPP